MPARSCRGRPCGRRPDLEESAQDEAEGLAWVTNGVEYVELQVAIDGLTVVVNPANDFATCLTVEQLATIYGPDSPENLLCSDVNPAFPAEPAERYMPGAAPGPV